MLTKDMIIDNKYKILDEIGSGGMSTVYRATVERSGKIWAVKEVKITETDDAIARQCLKTEIEILKNLNHSAIPQKIRTKIPEIADVIDNGDDGMIIIMDYIDGDSLDEVLKAKGPQSEEKVVYWAEQLCEVLGYLHSKKIIYRDMKPSNVMLRKNNEVAIIDFGTAKEYQTSSGETTGLGTAGYAAPEQYGDFGRTDARTDVFCLGMTMYSLLTGKDPRKEFIPDTSILKVNASFSPGLDHIIRKCTRKDPDERYQSCEELLYYLQNYKIIDKGSRKKKVVKLCLFISCLALSAISGTCGYLLGLQAKTLATDNYQEFMKQADTIIIDNENDKEHTAEKYAKKISLYQQAVAVPDKSGEKEAYLALLETYKQDDNVFSENELSELTSLINQNEASLKVNPENYLDICYETGNLLWYYYNDKSQMTKAKRAKPWFDLMLSYISQNPEDTKIQDYQNNPENIKKLDLAESYKEIGSFYDEIASRIKEGRDDGAYQKLFRNMELLINNLERKDKEKTMIVRLELIEMIRYALDKYAADFNRDGITKPEINLLYTRMYKAFEEIEIDESHPLYEKWKNIEKNIPDTEREIEIAYRT